MRGQTEREVTKKARFTGARKNGKIIASNGCGLSKTRKSTPKKTAFYDRSRNVVQYGRKKQATPRRVGITSLFDTACGIGFRVLYACLNNAVANGQTVSWQPVNALPILIDYIMPPWTIRDRVGTLCDCAKEIAVLGRTMPVCRKRRMVTSVG